MMEQLQIYEIEAVVIGCLLLGAPLEDINQYVSRSDFQTDEHRKIFTAITKQIEDGKPIDPVALLDQGLDISTISKIHEHRASAANASYYAQQLANLTTTQRIREHLASANSSLTPQNYLEIIADLTRKFNSLTDKQMAESDNWQQAISTTIAEIDCLNQRQSAAILSGLPGFDSKLEAIHGARLLILAARPGTGKTALAQQIALTSAKQGKSVGIISLEMSTTELILRSMANSFGVNGTSLAKGDIDGLSAVINDNNYAQFSNYKIYVDENTYKLEHIVARINQWKRKHQIEFAIIDHIGLVDVSFEGSRNESLGIVSRNLKQLTKRLRMPILCLCQLNRAIEKENREPRLSDIRESGHIEQDADMIIILSEQENEDSYPPSDDYKTIHPYLVKNRVGPKGRLKCWTFKGRTQRFVEE